MSKREQALYFPEPMLDEITREATRLDRSLSWCAQFAWTRQRARFADGAVLDALDARYAGDKRKQTLYFPAEMHAEMQAAATRLDCSISALVQRAWQLSRAELATVPDGPDTLEI